MVFSFYVGWYAFVIFVHKPSHGCVRLCFVYVDVYVMFTLMFLRMLFVVWACVSIYFVRGTGSVLSGLLERPRP